VFISVAILTLRCPSILDSNFSGQLRADYTWGQVCQGQVLVQWESKNQWVSSVQKEDSQHPKHKLDNIESYIAFV
jgi:hypothetical protein